MPFIPPPPKKMLKTNLHFFYHPFQLGTWNSWWISPPPKKTGESPPSLGTSAHNCSMGHFTGRQFFVLGVLEIFWEDGRNWNWVSLHVWTLYLKKSCVNVKRVSNYIQCILFGGAKTHVCVYEGRIVLMCMKHMWPGSLRVRTMEGGKA